jgi:hypothetical protein
MSKKLMITNPVNPAEIICAKCKHVLVTDDQPEDVDEVNKLEAEFGSVEKIPYIIGCVEDDCDCCKFLWTGTKIVRVE